jgi:hypothetical protein
VYRVTHVQHSSHSGTSEPETGFDHGRPCPAPQEREGRGQGLGPGHRRVARVDVRAEPSSGASGSVTVWRGMGRHGWALRVEAREGDAPGPWCSSPPVTDGSSRLSALWLL